MRYGFRPAHNSDRYQLLSLIDDGKDVPLEWRNRYLVEKNLKNVHVVDLMGRVIGMVHMQLLSKDEGWLESAYIHPYFRGKGIGKLFAVYQVEYLRSRGVRLVRLATGINNSRVRHFMGRLGFRELGTWYRVTVSPSYSPAAPVGYKVRRINEATLPEVVQFIRESRGQRKNLGIITSPRDAYVWRTLDESLLHDILSIGQSTACYNIREIGGIFLTAPQRGSPTATDSTVVLQAYLRNKTAYQTLLRYLVNRTRKNPILLSVSNLPDSVQAYIAAEAEKNTKLKLQTWVVLGKQVA